MTKLLTLLFISICSICYSQQSRRDLIVKEIESAQPWPLKFPMITYIAHSYEITIAGEDGPLAFKENGKWTVINGPAAIEVILSIEQANLKKIDELRKENARLREAIYSFSPQSFAVNSTTKKSL